jgi:hypothetical protein
MHSYHLTAETPGKLCLILPPCVCKLIIKIPLHRKVILSHFCGQLPAPNQLLRKPNLYYRVNKSLSLFPFLSQINPVHTLSSHLF